MLKFSFTSNGTGHQKWFRLIALFLLLTFSLTLMSCFGRFPMTHAVYNFNDTASDNKLVKTLIMWAFVIIPVYDIVMFGDAIIFNLVEFWTGEKVTVSGSVSNADGSQVTLTPSQNGKELIMRTSREGKMVSEIRFVKVSDTTFEVRDAKGEIKGKVIKTSKGDLNLTNAEGVVLFTISASDIAQVRGV